MALSQKLPFVIFLSFMIVNVFLWTKTHKMQTTWANVPPVPSAVSSKFIGFGDAQLAYRIYALMLQNIGSVSGRMVSLRDYDYATLKGWFFLTHSLDEKSNAVPMLAAKYFGAVDEPDKLEEIYDYLALVGSQPYNEKWRWLAHAVFIARHVAKDNDKALELAYILADNKDPDLADWAKQMPAFILQAQGIQN